MAERKLNTICFNFAEAIGYPRRNNGRRFSCDVTRKIYFITVTRVQLSNSGDVLFGADGVDYFVVKNS